MRIHVLNIYTAVDDNRNEDLGIDSESSETKKRLRIAWMLNQKMTSPRLKAHLQPIKVSELPSTRNQQHVSPKVAD